MTAPAGLAAVVAVTSRYAQVDGPNEVYPGVGFVPLAERREYMDAALAGIELGTYDRRIITWLLDWDDYTVRLVISLLVRARRAGYTEAAGDGAVLPPPRLDSEPWACRGCGAQMIGRRTAGDRCPECSPDAGGRS